MGLSILSAREPRIQPVEPEIEYVVGVDLGQSIDPTAIGVVERRREATGEWGIGPDKIRREIARERLALRHLERIPLRTKYTEIVSYLVELMATPPLDTGAALVVDHGGVGRGVVDQMRDAGLKPIAVTLTGGDKINHTGADWRVSKSMLIGIFDVKLNSGELEVAHNLPELDALKAELQDFRRKISAAGHTSFAAREGAHDDLILAAALAVWWASRPRFRRRIIKLTGF